MKAIIFDMDGVIIDSEPLHFKLEKGLLEELGGSISDEEHMHFVGTTDEHMWSTFKERFNLEPSVDEMVSMKKERFIENIEQVELVEGFKKFMLNLHEEGYPKALASSNNKKAVESVIKQFSLDKYIDFYISGEEVDKGKPDPEIFLTAAEKIKVDPSDCLVIEDANAGVKAAKAAGMKCIGFRNVNSGDQDLSKSDLVVDSFDELSLEEIKKLFK